MVIDPGSETPSRGSSCSAGWDCRAQQSVTLQVGRVTKVNLGLRAAIPSGYATILFSRSKLASEGITVQGGVIDADYRGPIQCLLYNSTMTPRRVTKGERVCQALFIPVPQINWIKGPLDRTERNENAFGSSGTH